MLHLLFVDDEPKLLEGLQRSLRSMRNEWNMLFVGGGEEALKVLEQTQIDIVVSDMRMPKMDGAQLSDEIQRRYPHIIRIILSGHSDKDMIFQSIGTTHQFLAKPCEVAQLKTTILRAYRLREVLKSDSLRTLVTGMRVVPSLPTLFMDIKKEAESKSPSLKAVGHIIAKDIGMAARLLQLVNSAYFGLAKDVSTAEQAVIILGLDTIQSLVLSVHVFSQFPSDKAAHFHIDRLWGESMKIGTLAKAIAKAEQCAPIDIERAYTAGLLQDVGMLVLAGNVPDQYDAVLMEASTKGCALWEAEQSAFGATHAEIGAYLLGLWGLSDPIVEAVAYHHRPGDCPGETFSPLTAVHVANALSQKQAESTTENVGARLDMAYLDKLKLAGRLPCWQKLDDLLEKEKAND